MHAQLQGAKHNEAILVVLTHVCSCDFCVVCCYSIGVILILLSCVVQGSQYVFEEKLMTEENAAPLLVVGMEGVWGVLIMVLVVFPWAQILPGSDQGACLENLADSWLMVQNSETVRAQKP